MDTLDRFWDKVEPEPKSTKRLLALRESVRRKRERSIEELRAMLSSWQAKGEL